jgi:Uma2 family endonuclease
MIKTTNIMKDTSVTETNAEIYLVLDISDVGLTDDQFFRLCRDNDDFDIEMTGEGELIIMSPNRPATGRKHVKLIQRLANWSDQDGTGDVYDATSIFAFPNGAKRSPDASWILKSRWDALTKVEQESFTPLISPDFVIEVRSPKDRMYRLKAKMSEYIANGVRLAWLLDPIDNRAYIYRPSESVQEIDKPEMLSGHPVLSGFHFDFREIMS